MTSAMIGNGSIMGLSLVGLSFFVLAVTAFNKDARGDDTWRALATAIIVTGLLGFTSFVQSAIQRQQEHDLRDAIDDAVTNAPIDGKPIPSDEVTP